MSPIAREELSSVVALAAKASTLAASAALVGSILYDWVYFNRLGLAFSEIPTSIADHTRSALLWLPTVSLGMAGAWLFELLTRRIEGGRTEDEIVAASPNPGRTRRFRLSGDLAPLVVAALIIAKYLLLGGTPYRWEFAFGAAALWSLFLRWVYAHPRIHAQSTPITFVTLFFGGLLAIVAVNRGGADADMAMATKHSTRMIIVKDEPRALEVTFFRSFEKGVLVKQPKEPHVEFIFWSEVERVKVPYTVPEPFVGLLCQRWSSGCERAGK